MTKQGETGVYIPKLPGCEPWNPMSAQKTRTTRLTYRHGVPQVEDPIRPSVDGEGAGTGVDLTQSQLLKLGAVSDLTVAPKVTDVTHWDYYEPQVPQWLAFDRRVLRFFAFFKEPVVESASENFRVRRVTIFYYLEDGTVHMGEPREDNSGIPQGVFLRRHMAELDSGEPLGIEHLTVGADLSLYGRTFHITGCDAFTREFLTAQGIAVAPDEAAPEDPHRMKETAKVAMRKSHRAMVRAKALEDLRKFFDYDRKVLRFFAVWDDRKNLYGDNLAYVLHYYLSDDTVEVNEVHARNTGRDPFPKLLARGRLPKNHQDTSAFLSRAIHYYDWSDLSIGTTVNVWGRPLFLYDCDAFTRAWYVRHGVPEEQLRAAKVDVEAKLQIPKATVAPDWYGIGSERDQMQSVNSLIPKPPKFNWDQFMEHGSNVLRFAARLVEAEGCRLLPADDVREFIITYFLADDTIQIYEPPIRNSGIIGGKFLERTTVKKPNSIHVEYRARDLAIGGHLVTLSRCFELYDADVFTFKFMEQNCRDFPQADAARVLGKCRAAVGTAEAREAVQSVIAESTDASTGAVPLPDVAAAFAAAGCDLTPHELVTLGRRLGDERGKAPIPAAKLLQEVGLSGN